MLLDENIDIKTIIKDHFLCGNKRACIADGRFEHHITHPNGNCLYNDKYDVIFPHDDVNDNCIEKYIRRFSRLKDMILDSSARIVLVYSSQASLEFGNFTIDNRTVVTDVYTYLSKIYILINKYNKNNKMIVFDCIKNENKEYLDKNIILYEMHSCYGWGKLFEQIVERKDIDFT
jgi:hypothetical protein